MTNKSTKKTTRLGHDPLEDIEVTSNENKTSNNQSIETVGKDEQNSNDKNHKELNLPSRFSIATVEEVYKRMSYILSLEQDQIELNPEEIKSVDTSAIQLLYAFTTQAKISGKNIHWKSRSETVDKASRILNINILDDTA